MGSRIAFIVRRLRERLWVKPFAYCLLAVTGAFVAHTADYANFGDLVPEISPETIEKLLSIISASMLAVATFAVASMVSAYASASSSATPRAFSLVVADDVSQSALSSFIGAFIFSIVAIIALKTGYYGRAGHFALFVMTLVIFAWVIITFVRWVDNIARLGRIGTTIQRAEDATLAALKKRKYAPRLGGVPPKAEDNHGKPVYGKMIGYVQHINMESLQAEAERLETRITVALLPGAFSAPGRPLAFVDLAENDLGEGETSAIEGAFLIGEARSFDEDPRFGLIVLSEIAARALSPAVNDPGTAISIIGVFVRLFSCWSEPVAEDKISRIDFDRVHVPALSLTEMFDDAFMAIARDGAGSVEVGIRLQKSFMSLASRGDSQLAEAAKSHSASSLSRAEQTLKFQPDIKRLRALAQNLGAVGGRANGRRRAKSA